MIVASKSSFIFSLGSSKRHQPGLHFCNHELCPCNAECQAVHTARIQQRVEDRELVMEEKARVAAKLKSHLAAKGLDQAKIDDLELDELFEMQEGIECGQTINSPLNLQNKRMTETSKSFGQPKKKESRNWKQGNQRMRAFSVLDCKRQIRVYWWICRWRSRLLQEWVKALAPPCQSHCKMFPDMLWARCSGVSCKTWQSEWKFLCVGCFTKDGGLPKL